MEQDCLLQHRGAANVSTSNKQARRRESRFVRFAWLDSGEMWSVDLQVLQALYI